MNQPGWARHYLEIQRELNPADPRVLKKLGIAYTLGGEGSLTKALACFSAYLDQHPDDREIWARQANILTLLGRTTEALAATENMEPGFARDLQFAEILEHSNLEQALAHGMVALEAQPKNPNASLLVARLLVRLGRHVQAKPLVMQAARLAPLNREIYYLKARIHQALDEPSEYRSSLSIFDVLEQVEGQGRRERLNPVQLLALLEQHHGLLPQDHPHLRWLRCRLLLQARRLDDAESLLARLQSQPGLTSQQVFSLARLSERAGLYQQSKSLYKRLLSIETEHREAKLGLARIMASTQGEGEALLFLESAFDQNAQLAQVHFLLGTLHLKIGHPEEAMVAFRDGLRLAPWQTQYRILLADYYLAEGRRQDLKHLVTEFEDRDPRWEQYKQRILGL